MDERFKPFNNKFLAVSMTEDIRARMTDYEGIKTADFVCVYGYVDPTLGLAFEVLAACKQSPTTKKFLFKSPNNDVRITLTAAEVAPLKMFGFSERGSKYRTKFKEKLDVVESVELYK